MHSSIHGSHACKLQYLPQLPLLALLSPASAYAWQPPHLQRPLGLDRPLCSPMS